MNITSKGGIFSFDLLFASLAVFLILFLIIQQESFFVSAQRNSFSNLLLEEKSLLLADSLVKNHIPDSPELGSAVFDLEKKRVISNKIDSVLLSEIESKEISSFYLSGIYLKYFEKESFLFFEERNGNCASVERFVSLNGRKTLLGVVLCE